MKSLTVFLIFLLIPAWAEVTVNHVQITNNNISDIVAVRLISIEKINSVVNQVSQRSLHRRITHNRQIERQSSDFALHSPQSQDMLYYMWTLTLFRLQQWTIWHLFNHCAPFISHNTINIYLGINWTNFSSRHLARHCAWRK